MEVSPRWCCGPRDGSRRRACGGPVLESPSSTDGLVLAHELAVRCHGLLKVTYVPPPEPELITVFLASPGGLSVEREITRDVVQRLNANIAQRLGAYLSLIMWEDEVPRFGRPQDLINRRGDTADLFIGLVYRRWGTPTGAYDSGFAEEFDRAATRRRAKGKPEIMLCFREVDRESVEDAGPQLAKVLDFKREVEAQGELLYASVADSSEWRDRLTEWLTSYLIDRRNESAVERTAERASAVQLEDPTGKAVEELRYMLARAVNELPETQKIVMTLRYYENFRLDEIANLLRITEEATADVLDRALTNVRLALGKVGIATNEDVIALLGEVD